MPSWLQHVIFRTSANLQPHTAYSHLAGNSGANADGPRHKRHPNNRQSQSHHHHHPPTDKLKLKHTVQTMRARTHPLGSTCGHSPTPSSNHDNKAAHSCAPERPSNSTSNVMAPLAPRHPTPTPQPIPQANTTSTCCRVNTYTDRTQQHGLRAPAVNGRSTSGHNNSQTPALHSPGTDRVGRPTPIEPNCMKTGL